jgi:predicted RNA-binding Zn-ribbon protein involved in translation (DUF1610 family)
MPFADRSRQLARGYAKLAPTRSSTVSPPIWIAFMQNDDGFRLFTCPVCGDNHIDEPSYDRTGCANYTICPSCGTEFSYDDANSAYAQLRKR